MDPTTLTKYIRDILTQYPPSQLDVLTVGSLRATKIIVDDQFVFQQRLALHKVGGTGQPAFAGTWVAGASTPFFFRDATGTVRIQGVVTGGATGTTIFTLPPGFKPLQQAVFPVVANGAFGAVTVNTDGTVVHTVGSTTNVFLDSISFRSSVIPVQA